MLNIRISSYHSIRYQSFHHGVCPISMLPVELALTKKLCSSGKAIMCLTSMKILHIFEIEKVNNLKVEVENV